MKLTVSGDDIPAFFECGEQLKLFCQEFPEGLDLSTPAGIEGLRWLYRRGIEVEYGLPAVLDSPEERVRFVQETCRRRWSMLGVAGQEDLARRIMELWGTPLEGEARRCYADWHNVSPSALDLVQATKRTEWLAQLTGGDPVAARDALLNWLIAWIRKEARNV